MEKIEHVYSEDKAASEAKEITRILNRENPGLEGVFTSDQYEHASQNIERRQLELIKNISNLDFPAYLAGGYAADVLLGESNLVVSSDSFGTHTDIDMAIKKQDRTRLENGIKKFGLSTRSVFGDGKSEPSKIYLKNASGLQADFAILDIDEMGEPFVITQIINNGETETIQVFLSRDMFDFEEISLDGQAVRVISPQSLIQSYSFYGEMRDKDKIRAKALIDKYFPGEPIDSPKFKPRVVSLSI